MACVALSSLRATIELEFLQPSPRVSLDDEASTSVESLFEKLSSLQAFVQEKSLGGVAAIRDLEIEIRDFALHAEDRIEIQLSNFVLSNSTQDQQKASQKLHQILGESAENAADLLKIIINHADDHDDEANQSDGQPLIPWLKHNNAASEPSNDTSSRHSSMVGRRRDHTVIKDTLLSPDRNLRVIPIVGMPGIGKTTLARSVFRDRTIAWRFGVRGWVTMSWGYTSSQMLHQLLWTIAEPDEIKKGSIPDDLAAEQVYNFLKHKRYLIVLDNLWNNQAWFDIRRCFPNDYSKSRIVLTTTHFSRSFSDPYTYIHNMTLLDPEEIWDIFCNNLSLEHTAPKYEDIRSQVVEKCEGLPHSIVVVAKRLSKCDSIHQEWKKVEKELELIGFLDGNALTFSYNQLPQHLKVCFLYFVVFPKRSAIRVKQLIRLWNVEGFVKPLEQEGLENQAYEYLQELIDRSLILIDTWSSDGKIKTCRMHSALHSFWVREAQKESIFCAVNTQQYPQGPLNMFANSCRWLSLYKHSFDYYVLFITNNPRSVLFFQEDAEIYVPFKLLRVLAFVPSSFLQRVPTRLHDLVFLRYLYVSEWFEGLNYVVLTNRNLQTLVVSSKESQLGTPTLHLPSTIWESRRLQHLELDKSYAIDPPSMDKDNMQTLSWLCPTHCRTGVYCRFPNIKKLKMFVFGSNPIILDNLEYLERLERLSISVWFGCAVTLPKPSMFPSQLKKLRLNGTNLSTVDLMVIGMLPQLEVLKLENAFYGEVWEVEEGFFRLKFLLLENKKLKQWRVDKDSFQCLKHLVLRFCYCLEEIPMIMEDILTLESIELQQCCPSIITSAECIIESQRDAGNNILEIKIIGPEYDESQESVP